MAFGNDGTRGLSNVAQTLLPQQEHAALPMTTVEPPAQKLKEMKYRRTQEAKQRHLQSLPEPPAPVALNKIEGIWWTTQDIPKSDMVEHKEFAFVDDSTFVAGRYTAHLSMSNGTNMIVQCFEQSWPMEGARSAFYPGDRECHLPQLTWIRIMANDVVSSPKSDHWGISYTEGEADNPVLSDFLVKSICYPDGACMTAEEAGRGGLEK